MNAIYSSRPVAPSPRRRWTMVTTSALLHGGLATVVLLAGVTADMTPIAADHDEPLRFVNFVPPPEPPPPMRQPVRLPPPKELARLDAPAPVPVLEELPPPEPIEEARVVPVPPEPEPAPPTPIVERSWPVVQVGGFAAAVAVTQTATAKTVEQAGFDRTDDRLSERARAGAVVGAFDSAAAARTAPGTGKAIGVADAGFGTGAASPGSAARGRAVAAAGFDSIDAPPAAAKAPVQARIEIAVEIVSKPTPEYTAEARALKIEGEVTLDVEFAATGEIRVHRVVRGLGHGLDDMAIRAVQGMRFKPARRNGEAVSVRAPVTIVFRLA